MSPRRSPGPACRRPAAGPEGWSARSLRRLLGDVVAALDRRRPHRRGQVLEPVVAGLLHAVEAHPVEQGLRRLAGGGDGQERGRGRAEVEPVALPGEAELAALGVDADAEPAAPDAEDLELLALVVEDARPLL